MKLSQWKKESIEKKKTSSGEKGYVTYEQFEVVAKGKQGRLANMTSISTTLAA